MKYLSSKRSMIDTIIFTALILHTLLGVALTNVSPAHAHKYWLAMILFFAIGAIATGWQRATEKGQKTVDHFSITSLGQYPGCGNRGLYLSSYRANSKRNCFANDSANPGTLFFSGWVSCRTAS